MKNKKITIVSSCNDAFAEHVSALFVSVLENTDRSTKLFDFYVIDDEISIANKRLMRETLKEYDAMLHFLTIDKNTFQMRWKVNGFRKLPIIELLFQNYSATKTLSEFST